jgi:hypothetical protein
MDVTARLAGAECASGSLEQFGYRQELKRALSLFDLVIYGVVFRKAASKKPSTLSSARHWRAGIFEPMPAWINCRFGVS